MNNSTAQPLIQWQTSLGGTLEDEAWSVAETSDGGCIAAGITKSSNGNVTGFHGFWDYWVVKLDDSGGLQWQKCLGGSGFERAYSVTQATDGGYIVAGWTDSNNGNVSGNHGQDDGWVVKLDGSGNIAWQKCLGGSFSDRLEAIQQTTDGGYIVAGWAGSIDGDVSGNHGNYDYWLVKLNSIGSLQWQKSLGGSSTDQAHSVRQTSDGGYILGGQTTSDDGDVSGRHGVADQWIVKVDSLGNIEWQKCLGGTGHDVSYSVEQTTDGGYIVAGNTGSDDGDVVGPQGGNDSWVVKLDGSGNIQWQKCLGGTSGEHASTVVQTEDGGYVVAGGTSSNNGDVSGNHSMFGADSWVVKLDDGGNIQWQKCLGGIDSETANSIQPTADGGFLVGGLSDSNSGDVTGNHGWTDMWIVKLAPSTVAIDEEAAGTVLSAFPNPFTDELTVSWDRSRAQAAIQVWDMYGRSVHTQKQATNDFQLATTNWPQGFYLLEVTVDGERTTKKVVKE